MAIKEMLDDDVFSALETMRRPSDECISKVLRRILNLPEPPSQERKWVTGYGEFEHGTIFRADYKGAIYTATVIDGALEYSGVRYTSPTAASCCITGVQTTGGRFWKVEVSNKRREWIFLSEFKRLNEYKNLVGNSK